MNAPVKTASTIPFDAARLDKLMDEAGMDVLIATSKHNVQYLLGGHRAFFFDYMDAMGLQPLPAGAGLCQGRARQGRLFRPSAGKLPAREQSVLDAGAAVQLVGLGRHHAEGDRAHPQARASRPRGIGAELSFLPVDAGKALQDAFADSQIRTRCSCWSGMRAIKTPDELKKLKIASEAVIESMQAVIAKHGPGATKAELTEALRREETNRGLTFEYCLITAGTSLNRAPSRSGLGRGRHPVAQLRRQLSRLYRRPLPHGDPGRARRRARGHAGRHRGRSSAPR